MQTVKLSRNYSTGYCAIILIIIIFSFIILFHKSDQISIDISPSATLLQVEIACAG